jgi:iron complex outermembrane receptor protein
VGNEGPVAFYVDGVYQLSLMGLAFELPDVQNVEVLKGPQGTLFGRNATAGAIQINTREPEFKPQGDFFVSYGRFNDVLVNAFVTAPINDKVAFSIAGSSHYSDGYIKDFVTGKNVSKLKSYLVRGKLRFDLTENFEAVVTGYYSQRDSNAIASVALNGVTVARDYPGAIIAPGPFNYSGVTPLTEVENYGANLRLKLETELGTLSALSAFVRWNALSFNDFDKSLTPGVEGATARPVEEVQTLSQELNFSSRKFGDVSFVAGLFYFDAFGRVDPQSLRGTFPFTLNVDQYGRQPIKAAAAYGEMTYEVTPKLTAIAGLRYSSEKRKLIGRAVPGGVDPGPLPELGSRRDSSFTPRFSLRYEVDDDWNIYATYSRGFKSGGFNTTALTPPVQTVAPETVDAYEIGSKSRFGPLSLNLAAYYYNYNDLQVSAAQIINGIQVQLLQNAAKARMYGLDIDATLAITQEFRLTLGAALLNAKYESFPGATINTPRPNLAGNITSNIDVSGNYLNRAPKLTANLTAQYVTETSAGEIDLSSSLYYSSRYYFEANNRISQPSYALLEARAAFTPAGSNLTLAIFGRNLTDEVVLGGGFPSSFSDAVQYQPPRTYGVSAAFSF